MLLQTYHYGSIVLALAAVYLLATRAIQLWVYFQMWAILKPTKITVSGSLLTLFGTCITYLFWFFLVRP